MASEVLPLSGLSAHLGIGVASAISATFSSLSQISRAFVLLLVTLEGMCFKCSDLLCEIMFPVLDDLTAQKLGPLCRQSVEIVQGVRIS